MSNLTNAKLKEIAERIRQKKLNAVATPATSVNSSPSQIAKILEVSNAIPEEAQSRATDKYGNIITYNSQQLKAINLAKQGESFVLIGAAGTGKTTCMKGVTQTLIESGKIPRMNTFGHRHLKDQSYGIVICAFTKIAVNNIRKNLSADLQDNCITIHKLLEFQPEYYEVVDEVTGAIKRTMSFEPSRNAVNPLPEDIKVVVFEEASMLGTDLYKQYRAALRHDVIEIFLGDIQQLSPVFGPAILGFKMLEYPVVELNEVYRQALESPIISLAHRIISGVPIPSTEFKSLNKPGELTIHPWKKTIHPDTALATTAKFFEAAFTNNHYDPMEDMILCPFNKSFGTIELNKFIANFLARSHGRETFEIIAGFNSHYLSVGDRIMYDREAGEVVSIKKNSVYVGKKTKESSTTLDYWGYDPEELSRSLNYSEASAEDSLDEVDKLLEMELDDEERTNNASHVVEVYLQDSDRTVTLNKSAEINALLLGYALTVHKSQGSEWRKVFFVTHKSHATMMQRELLYTAVTRAREELYIICEPEAFIKGIKSQKIKGDTIAEKAEFFKGKVKAGEYEGDY